MQLVTLGTQMQLKTHVCQIATFGKPVSSALLPANIPIFTNLSKTHSDQVASAATKLASYFAKDWIKFPFRWPLRPLHTLYSSIDSQCLVPETVTQTTRKRLNHQTENQAAPSGTPALAPHNVATAVNQSKLYISHNASSLL